MRGNGMKMRLFSAESQFQSLRWGMLLSIDCDRFAKFEEKNIWYRKYLMFNYLQILALIVLNWKDLTIMSIPLFIDFIDQNQV